MKNYDDRPTDFWSKKLIEFGQTLACAESCTGGGLSARITDIPGISAVFKVESSPTTTGLSLGSCRCLLTHSSNRVRCLNPWPKPWHRVCGRCCRPTLPCRQPVSQVQVAAAWEKPVGLSGWRSPVHRVLDRKNKYFPAIENKFALRQSNIAYKC